MEKYKKKLNKTNIAISIIALLVFTLIFALNSRTMYVSDDFLYKFEFFPGRSVDGDLNPVSGLLSIVKSQYHHYSMWNGRFVAHTIVQFFMQFDKSVFNFFNTLIFIFLGFLITKIGSHITLKKINPIVLLLVYILLFLSIPSFGQTVLWISGSGNYLWMSVIYLGFFYFNIKSKKDSVYTILNAMLIGFLAGATNENSGPATILMVIMLTLYQYNKNRKVDMWRIVGIVSSFIGFSLILLAPAAAKRVETREEVALTFDAIMENLSTITTYIVNNYLTYLLVIVILILILQKNKKLNESIVAHISILFIGFLGATYSLAVVDRIIERTMFGATIFLITITIILLIEFIDYISEIKILLIGVAPILLVFIFVYNVAYQDINYTYSQIEEQYEIIYAYPNEDVTVPMISQPETDYNAYRKGTNYLKESNDAWLNRWAARFFNVNSLGGYQIEWDENQ